MSEPTFSQTLRQVLTMRRPAIPWQDGTKVPWHDPELSRRLLDVHLDPETHLASRGPGVIEQHVHWLRSLASGYFPEEQSPRLLDLGCGPGLYCQALARAGWQTVGVDISPASIAHADQAAAREGLDCRYLQRSVLDVQPEELTAGVAFDLATFWYGELNAFVAEDLEAIIRLAAAALAPGGLLVLEPQPWDRFTQEDHTEWEACERSFWGDEPHLWLREHTWDEELSSEITVHWIIDGRTGQARRFAQCHQAYRPGELEQLLESGGMRVEREFPPISDMAPDAEFPVLVARRAG